MHGGWIVALGLASVFAWVVGMSICDWLRAIRK